MAIDPHDPIAVQSGGTWSSEAQVQHEIEQGIGSYGHRPGNEYESDGSGFVALVKLAFIGFVLSGLSGVFQSLSGLADLGWELTPPSISKPAIQKINHLDLMLPADGFRAARNRKPHQAESIVKIDNRSSNRYLIYRFQNQYKGTNPGPLVREATVDSASQLEIVCHVDQVFTIVRDDGSMFGYIAADSEPGTLQIW